MTSLLTEFRFWRIFSNSNELRILTKNSENGSMALRGEQRRILSVKPISTENSKRPSSTNTSASKRHSESGESGRESAWSDLPRSD